MACSHFTLACLALGTEIKTASDVDSSSSSSLQIAALTNRPEESNRQCRSFPGDEKQRVLSLLPNGALPGDGKGAVAATQVYLLCRSCSQAGVLLFCAGRQASHTRISASAHLDRAGRGRTEVSSARPCIASSSCTSSHLQHILFLADTWSCSTL